MKIRVIDFQNPAPSRPPQWRIWGPRRVGGFRWLTFPENWFETNNLILEIFFKFVSGIAVLVDCILLMPTVGLIRLAIHHHRHPGWFVECRYGTALVRAEDPRVEVHTRAKRQAKRMRRVLNRELIQSDDFDAPGIQNAIVRNQATLHSVSNQGATKI